MKNVIKMKSLSTAMLAGILVLASCSKSADVLNSSDVQNVNSEAVADSYTSETSDMGNTVVSSVTTTQYGTGREAASITGLEGIDGRLTGATITLTPGPNSTRDNPNGTITIDFGTGKTTNGVTRKGLITITYAGRKFIQGATRVISFTNYSRNSVVFDNGMTYTVTNASDSTAGKITLHHVLSAGKLTFPDNTFITRNTDFNETFDYGAKTLTLSASTAAHSATGTTRAGKEYTTDITSPIVYKGDCIASKVFIPVSGEKSVTAGLVNYKVNFGDGTCDNTVTITLLGKTATITVNADGN